MPNIVSPEKERFLLKDIYSLQFFNDFIPVLNLVLPGFDEHAFRENIFTENWKGMALKQRMNHISDVLHQFMPQHFPDASNIITRLVHKLEEADIRNGLAFLFLPDYIEKFGISYFDASVKVIEAITAFTSCEFAVRPFILKYGTPMLNQMTVWSEHENHHVRRLASEGSRPRLPWAMALPALKKDPEPVLPLLENLKKDPSEYVRRSVANHLNDISKDNPEVLYKIIENWQNTSPETTWILKHASRTLLKKGDRKVLQFFGYTNCDKITLNSFEVITPQVSIGNYLEFAFQFTNQNSEPQKIRLEYGIDYLRANGSYSSKIFKISEKIYQPQEVVKIKRKQSFKFITTRKFYPGLHRVAIILNGEEKAVKPFKLVDF